MLNAHFLAFSRRADCRLTLSLRGLAGMIVTRMIWDLRSALVGGIVKTNGVIYLVVVGLGVEVQ